MGRRSDSWCETNHKVIYFDMFDSYACINCNKWLTDDCKCSVEDITLNECGAKYEINGVIMMRPDIPFKVQQ